MKRPLFHSNGGKKRVLWVEKKDKIQVHLRSRQIWLGRDAEIHLKDDPLR